MEHVTAGDNLSRQIDGHIGRWDTETACMLVGSYDYARAAALLSVFSTPHMEGPYIVSTAQPLGAAGALPSQYLY
jgi:hypothetical protein